MTYATDWTPELVERLRIMVRNSYSIRMMAARTGISRPTVHAKLREMGLRPAARATPTNDCGIVPVHPRHKRPTLAPIVFPDFHDHPDADADKHTGRVPRKADRQSLTGNSSDMCVGAW